MPPVPRKKKPANVAALSVEVLSGADGQGEPPKEFRIFKPGLNESTKGVWKFTPAAADRVMAKAREHGNDLAIDYAHGMVAFFAVDPAESGKAAGWFRPEVREGALWASNVTWTPKAKQGLIDREWRYISPAFNHDDAGEILSLTNVALTNIPALYELEPLVASRGGPFNEAEDEEREPPMNWKQLLAMLSLGENASEAEAMAALSRRDVALSELLSITGKTDAGGALGVVKAWKTAADSVPAMHAELSQLKGAQLEAERDALIADGKRRGVVPPAYEPVLKQMELSQLKEFLKVAVPVHQPAGKEKQDVTTETVALSQEDRDVAKQLGITEADFAKRKALRRGMMLSAPPDAAK